MSLSFQSDRVALISKSDASSLTSLLERGLQYIQQGRYSEGAAFLGLARERLTPEQTDFAAALDALTRSHASYSQAQQSLHEANKRFVEADAEHQARLAALTKLLPTLSEEISNILPTGVHSVKNVKSQQPLLDKEDSIALPALYFVCFGRFEVRRNGQSVLLCPSRKGQAVLRYLIAHPEHRASIDMLMTMLWAEDAINNVRHKLQVAISALRSSLNRGYESNQGGGYILCHNQVYLLNPVVTLQSDVDEFLASYQAGRQARGSATAVQYERACQLYTGPFLTEDLYASWSFMQREHLSQVYLTMCNSLAEHYLEAGRYEDTIKWARAILKENPCDEAAHRHLMRAYTLSRRRSEALQQYKRCQSVLFTELGVQPAPETMNLFYAIQSSEYPPDKTKK